MPIESAIFGEKTMLAALQKNPPDHVLITPTDLGEYGYRAFGADYGMELAGWGGRNYGKIKPLGPSRTKEQEIIYRVWYASRIAESNPSAP